MEYFKYNFENEDSKRSEIDSSVLDAVLLTSFDWKELANRLSAFGKNVPNHALGMLHLPHVIHRMAHSSFRADVNFSQSITSALDRMHSEMIKEVSHACVHALCHKSHDIDMNDRKLVASYLWALVRDPREGVRKIAGVFSQRLTSWFVQKNYYSNNPESDNLNLSFKFNLI